MNVTPGSELFFWPPKLLYQSVLLVLYYPVKIAILIFQSLVIKYSILQHLFEKNKPISFSAVWDLIVWGFIALMIILVPLVILKDTICEVTEGDGEQKKRLHLINIAVIIRKYCSYYVLTAILLYILFEYIVPLKMVFGFTK